MKTYFTLIFFLSFSVIHCCAKQSRLYGNGELSCNLITKICQDKEGFIWIGTANGLNKFDGWSFSRYFHQENNANSLLSNYVHSLYTDSEGTLWIGTNKGLQRYLPYEEVFQPVTFPDNLQPSVEGIIELHTGEIRIATSGRGVFSVDKKAMKAITLEEVNNACENLFLSCIYEDRSHVTWIPFSNNKVLRMISGEKETFQTFDTPGSLISFAEDDDGRLYTSSTTGISWWDPANEVFIPLKSQVGVLTRPKMLLSKKGTIYIGTSGQGLNYIDTESMEIHRVNGLINREINLEKAKVESLMEDKNGNLWVGCFRKGLLMVPNESSLFDFWDFSTFNYQSGDCISSIYRDKEGIVWAGAENGKVMQLDESGRMVASYSLQNSIASLFEDSNRTFWIGANYGGLMQFDKHTGNYRYIPDLQGEYIKTIAEDRYKNVYFSVFGKGLRQYNSLTHKWRSITGNEETASLKNNWINTILNDSQGRVWLGHYKGIDCYDPGKDQFYTLKNDSILHSTICYSLLEGEQGVIWIGTNNGLYKYNYETGQFTHYSTNNGLTDNVICGLAKDHSGNIWCSTFRGLCKIQCNEDMVYPYSSGNGLFDKEYSRGVYFQYNNQEVYFGGVYGITRFSPDSIQRQEITKEPLLTRLFLNNQATSGNTYSGEVPICGTKLLNASSLHLSYKDNTFSLEFSMMNYNNPENIHYEYRLSGVNNEWLQTPPGSNRISYNRLPSGKYTLDIRACENGAYSPVKTISIEIIPPWYLSPIAKTGYVLLLLILIGSISHFSYRRIQRLRQEEINEEKLKFFINISHEIRSPITLILSPLSMLMKREHDEATTQALSTMHRNATRIATLLNQLLDIRRIDKGQMTLAYSQINLVEFIDEQIKNFDYLANKQSIRLSFDHTDESLPAWIDRNNFDKILTNLLDNALKFTPEKGEINISLTSGKDENRKDPLSNYIEINITDSGIGLDKKKTDKIFERFYQISPIASSGSGIGLHLCKTLIELHHGTITAANRKDSQGSCFTIQIPSGNDHLKKEEIINIDPAPQPVLKQNIYSELTDESKPSSGKSKNKNKVLVIDDNIDICHYLEQELKPFYRVTTCNTGTEGFKIALDIVPDLIISDIVMPEMDGFTLLKKIKTNNNISHIPVILLTSRIEYDYRIKGWDQGADAILTKPFNIEELLLLSSNLIAGRLRLKGKFAGFQDQKEKVKLINLKSNEEELMDRLMHVINANIDNSQLNVEVLAKEIGISRVQLHRKLKEITGISASEFIRNIRLNQAAKLLKTKNINISQVAYAVGYSSHALFSTAFKKFYGISPSEFAEKEMTILEEVKSEE